MDEFPSCRDCGEPIGVYEPLIALVEGQPRETSRAAQTHLGELAAECYHRACYERRDQAREKRR
jgi:hypothetical protein